MFHFVGPSIGISVKLWPQLALSVCSYPWVSVVCPVSPWCWSINLIQITFYFHSFLSYVLSSFKNKIQFNFSELWTRYLCTFGLRNWLKVPLTSQRRTTDSNSLICTVVTILDNKKNAKVKATVFILTSENFKVFHGVE